MKLFSFVLPTRVAEANVGGACLAGVLRLCVNLGILPLARINPCHIFKRHVPAVNISATGIFFSLHAARAHKYAIGYGLAAIDCNTPLLQCAFGIVACEVGVAVDAFSLIHRFTECLDVVY